MRKPTCHVGICLNCYRGVKYTHLARSERRDSCIQNASREQLPSGVRRISTSCFTWTGVPKIQDTVRIQKPARMTTSAGNFRHVTILVDNNRFPQDGRGYARSTSSCNACRGEFDCDVELSSLLIFRPDHMTQNAQLRSNRLGFS